MEPSRPLNYPRKLMHKHSGCSIPNRQKHPFPIPIYAPKNQLSIGTVVCVTPSF